MKIIHIFLNVVSYLFFLLLLIVGFLTLSSNTSLLGSYESLLVRSGSMEPTIMTGDVIFAKQLNQYNKNDVVAFKDEGDRVITHRIVKIDESECKKLVSDIQIIERPLAVYHVREHLFRHDPEKLARVILEVN